MSEKIDVEVIEGDGVGTHHMKYGLLTLGRELVIDKKDFGKKLFKKITKKPAAAPEPPETDKK
jgi:hypothetical protein